MTTPSESSPLSPDSNAPFAPLHPVLQGINQAIYAFWNLPLPEDETLTNQPTNVDLSVPSPKTFPVVDQPTEPISPQSDSLKALPESSLTPPAAPPSPNSSGSQAKTVKSQTSQCIARLGKMHWSKPKAANCSGRRKLKR